MDKHMARKTGMRRLGFSILRRIRHYQYSLTQMGIAVFAILLVITFLVTASISTYYNNLLQTQYYNNMMDILRFYNNERSSDLSALETYLFQLAAYNSDISVLNTTSDNTNYQNAKIKIHLLLSEALPTFDKIDGLYFYSLPADDYVYASHTASKIECFNYIRDFLHENGASLPSQDAIYAGWIPYQTENQTYLIRFLRWGNSLLGAWSSVDTLTSDFSGVFSNDSVVCYADQEMHILNNAEFSSFAMPDEDFLEHYQIYLNPKTNIRYLVASQTLAYSDCYLIAFIPLDHIHRHMIPVYKQLFVIIVILSVAVIAIAVVFKRLMDMPAHSLERLLDKVSYEDENAVIPIESSRCQEISSLNKVLRDMVQKIHDLKINVYEEKLLQAKLEMQYLKAQVSPHFLINCLTTFSTLATSPDPEGEHRYVLRKMVDTLSNHLRYTLSSRSMVSLKEECSYVDNYLQLVSIRYPGCLVWQTELADEIQDAAVFPMLLLMLTENTIKYNMIMGERLQVIIQAFPESHDGDMFAHIVHMDSGTGFTPEILLQNSSILEHPEICRDGHNIGIYNIARSLHLTYHGRAKIRFSNEPGMGARIDISIPCRSVS